jgi:hypothetical protein
MIVVEQAMLNQSQHQDNFAVVLKSLLKMKYVIEQLDLFDYYYSLLKVMVVVVEAVE